MARPKAIDGHKQDQLCGLVSLGISRWQAAKHLGVHRTTLYRALRDNPVFDEQLRQAELQHELRPVRQITEQMPKDWRAGAWLLERLLPDFWMKRQPNTVTLADMHGIFGAMIKLVMEGVSGKEDRKQVSANFERFFQRLGGKKRCSPRVRQAITELELERELQKVRAVKKQDAEPPGPEAAASDK